MQVLEFLIDYVQILGFLCIEVDLFAYYVIDQGLNNNTKITSFPWALKSQNDDFSFVFAEILIVVVAHAVYKCEI